MLDLERFYHGHSDKSMNEWKFWLSPGLIKNKALINQRTHNLEQFIALSNNIAIYGQSNKDWKSNNTQNI